MLQRPGAAAPAASFTTTRCFPDRTSRPSLERHDCQTGSYSDATHFVRSVARAGFPHAMIVGLSMMDPQVTAMDGSVSDETGVLVSVQTDFGELLTDALTWSCRPLPDLLRDYPLRVVTRLSQLEVKPSSMAEWGELVSRKQI